MGDNVYVGDRNGVRSPMQWSDDRNAGFSRANPHKLYLPLIVESEYHYTTVNVEAQRSNPNSLLNAMKRLISTRKRFQAFGRGDFQLLHPSNRKVLVFTRTYKDECILVVANLSRFVQTIELDLSMFADRIPVEIFGRTEFPPIQSSPYFLSIGAYAFYWFSLKFQPSEVVQPEIQKSTLQVTGHWTNVLTQPILKATLETTLPDYLLQYRQFEGKIRPIQSAQILETIAIPYQDTEAQMVWLQINYIQGQPQTCLVILAYAESNRAKQLLSESPNAVIATLNDQQAVLFTAIADKNFLSALLDSMVNRTLFKGNLGQLKAMTAHETELPMLEPSLLRGDHNNTSIVYSDSIEPKLILKLFCKLEQGIHPDLEMR